MKTLIWSEITSPKKSSAEGYMQHLFFSISLVLLFDILFYIILYYLSYPKGKPINDYILKWIFC